MTSNNSNNTQMIKPQGVLATICDCFMNWSYVFLTIQNTLFATYKSLFIASIVLAAFIRKHIAKNAGLEDNRPAYQTVMPANHEKMVPKNNFHNTSIYPMLSMSLVYFVVPVMRLLSVNESCYFFPFLINTAFGLFLMPMAMLHRVISCTVVFIVAVLYCTTYLQGQAMTMHILIVNFFWPVLLVFAIIFILQMYSSLAIEKLKETNTELEKNNKTKSEFLSMLGHEIRTPLNAIVGSADSLLLAETNEQNRSILQIILSSASILLENVNSMLSYFVLEKGANHAQNILDLVEFDLFQMCNDVYNMLQVIAKAKGLDMQFTMKQEKCMVRADKVRIREICVNLLSNACKFTKQGRVTFSVTKEDGNFVFVVSDSGIGISDEFLNKMYQPFSQQDMSIKRSFGGTGLGLSISRGHVTLMNGSIACASKLGQGTTFTVKLPLELVETAMSPSTDAPATPACDCVNIIQTPACACASSSCLVVDDNLINLKVMGKMLSSINSKYLTAESGAHALDLVKSNNFDVIFIDLHMSDNMNGIETCTRIRQYYAQLNKPCPKLILVTGTEHSLLPENASLLFDEYCQKPIRLESLRNFVMHQR